ncbi:hypothetical protein V5O48_002172 [Marasmius crinis-equi]|uniref:F-box domain-containing protein n=1 Tax=Marasmius crinis-equi TaxID=585013 RepID=A0ABR3FWW2_9AGAR
MQLPIELWEVIIDHCRDDTPSLLSCALVCKVWSSKSRQLFFSRHTVKLHASDTEDFSDLPCTFKFYITAIKLSGDGYTEIDVHQDVDVSLLRLSQTVIDECTSLKSLKLYMCSAENALPLFSTSLPLCSSLTTLHLWGSLQDRTELLEYSLEAGKLLDLIGNFTVLENLSMNYDTPGKYIRDAVDPADGIGRKKTTLELLRNLDLDLPLTVFLPLFLIPGVLRFPSVEKLEIFFGYLRTGDQLALPLIQPYLELFSSSLQELILLLDWDNIPVLNLSHFKNLRSILFVVESEVEESISEHFQELCDIVRSTREGEGEGKGKRIGDDPQPLTVIVTIHKETAGPPDIEGVTWILDERYYADHYGYEDQSDPNYSDQDNFACDYINDDYYQ